MKVGHSYNDVQGQNQSDSRKNSNFPLRSGRLLV